MLPSKETTREEETSCSRWCLKILANSGGEPTRSSGRYCRSSNRRSLGLSGSKSIQMQSVRFKMISSVLSRIHIQRLGLVKSDRSRNDAREPGRCTAFCRKLQDSLIVSQRSHMSQSFRVRTSSDNGPIDDSRYVVRPRTRFIASPFC